MSPIVDDSTVLDSDHLIRRVHQIFIKYDDITGEPTVSSAAFQTPSEGRGDMSVDWKEEMERQEVDVISFLVARGAIAAVTITGKQCRAEELAIARVPLCDNPFHAEVGRIDGERLAKRQRKSLKNQRLWLIEPPQPA